MTGGMQALMGIPDANSQPSPNCSQTWSWDRGAELLERLRVAYDVDDRAGARQLAGLMLAHDWFGPVLEAAILDRMAAIAAGRAS